MVDPNNVHGPGENGAKIKSFMGRTPSFIKSKFLSVLGSSNDLLNGISNRLEISLSLSTSSDTETADNHDAKNKSKTSDYDDDESMDENIIDFESRKVKERRAHEEVKSGRYRQPNFITKITSDEYNIVDINQMTSSSLSNSNSNYSLSRNSITSLIKEIDCDNVNIVATPMGTTQPQQTHEEIKEKILQDKLDIAGMVKDTLQINQRKLDNVSSISTSENDLCIPSISLESSDLKMWIRSESENSVPSWASSISLDSQTEEATLEFMRHFVAILYEDSTSITLDIKAEFGHKARTETGRLWFARLVSAQRGKNKRVNEQTFYSLIQYFAIVLFECCESEDFSPAKILMNMCFTFYHEVDVPGCEPYREYLYTYLREQPIWQSLRFWNAAFFDALQCERIHRPVPPSNSSFASATSAKQTSDQISLKSNSELDGVSAASSPVHKECDNNLDILKEDQKFHQNISFGQLGTFTCNMHAFGLSRELCSEFLRKQCVIANLSKEQEKMLRDNISRMYKETAKWRT